MVIREERRGEGEKQGGWYYIGEIACTYVMQRAQLAILYVLDSLHTYNGHLGREGEENNRGSKAVDII